MDSVHNLLIKVRENEYKALLDRDKTTEDVKQLRPWLLLIRDITDYGTNLIPRCIGSSDRKLEDAVLVAALLRQVVAMLDGVEVLLSGGAVYAANLQMRALFEASVYVDWMLAGDLEKKAQYYYVHNLRRIRMWARRAQPGSSEWQEFSSTVKDFGIKIEDHVKNSAKGTLQETDRVLSQAKFAAVNDDFETCRKKRGREPAWYVPLGITSVGAMSRAVGRYSLYVMLYSGASDVMHTSNYGHHFQIGTGRLTLQPIRSLEKFENVLRFSNSLAIHTFQRILEKYRPEERAAFARKYAENWRHEFLNFPKIEYRPTHTEI
jgi:hypothetical protein